MVLFLFVAINFFAINSLPVDQKIKIYDHTEKLKQQPPLEESSTVLNRFLWYLRQIHIFFGEYFYQIIIGLLYIECLVLSFILISIFQRSVFEIKLWDFIKGRE
ncbi:hypothetical protein HZS_3276 [Henneguya salminicola]|nr:hypothetical protein HZS_3276 [Henneguya salminicola]